jgi:hypothetical protein
MANVAFNLRGTNGSGKTYVAKHLLRWCRAKPTRWNGKKPLIYHGTFEERPIAFLGSYVTSCGGCDTIPSVKMVAELLQEIMENHGEGIVFYEGLMISHMIGTVGLAVRPYGPRHTMAFLDTPLDICIQRVRERRIANGNDKPFDPNRTLIKDYCAVQRAKENAVFQGFQVATIDHTKAIEQSMAEIRKLLKL